jgi:UDP-glucose 4-epimerase
VNVLVTGGAGYIGAHLVRLLADRGDGVVVADDLATGEAARIGEAPLIRLNLADAVAADVLGSALRDHRIDTVVHFAARKQVGESVARPAWYYQQNIGGLANLLLAVEQADVPRLVFSSSAAVYGPSDHPLAETDPTGPVSPYGQTKLIGEWLSADAATAWGLRAVSLRYFNVAGAGAPELGDTAALNLIPMVLEKLDAGEAPVIFGDDYPTPDGTCIRDYIHVQDVAEAHLAAIDGLDPLGPGHHLFNLGTGTGSSVREIVERVLAVSGSELEPVVAARRPGDPANVVAAVDRIRAELGWSARFGLDEIVQSAWDAHQYESPEQ